MEESSRLDARARGLVIGAPASPSSARSFGPVVPERGAWVTLRPKRLRRPDHGVHDWSRPAGDPRHRRGTLQSCDAVILPRDRPSPPVRPWRGRAHRVHDWPCPADDQARLRGTITPGLRTLRAGARFCDPNEPPLFVDPQKPLASTYLLASRPPHRMGSTVRAAASRWNPQGSDRSRDGMARWSIGSTTSCPESARRGWRVLARSVAADNCANALGGLARVPIALDPWGLSQLARLRGGQCPAQGTEPGVACRREGLRGGWGLVIPLPARGLSLVHAAELPPPTGLVQCGHVSVRSGETATDAGLAVAWTSMGGHDQFRWFRRGRASGRGPRGCHRSTQVRDDRPPIGRPS